MQRKHFSATGLNHWPMTFKIPELLVPAGSRDKMRAAFNFGDDAVCAAQPHHALQARNNKFRLE